MPNDNNETEKPSKPNEQKPNTPNPPKPDPDKIVTFKKEIIIEPPEKKSN